MSGSTTKRMLAAYIQMAAPTMFLSGLFQSPARNFFNSEEVEIDIVRSDEEVSLVVTDLSTGYRMNSDDLYTNKGFKPPIHKEAIALNSSDLLKRVAGEDPFQDPNFRANVINKMFSGMTKVEAKIRRAVELQASQVLQLGVVTLTDGAGNPLYTIDYKPKASHFPTAGTAWNAGGATIAADISSLAEEIRNDGLADPDQLIMGVDAFNAFISDPDIQARYDNRRIDRGNISPMEMRGNGGSYRGVVEIGHYRYDIWTYGGRYNHPVTGVKTQFIAPASCIVRASSGRLDAAFGSIPNIGKLIGGGNGNLIPELPGRIANAAGGMDLSTNTWLSESGEELFGGVGARPLMIPTAIDTYGNIATGV